LLESLREKYGTEYIIEEIKEAIALMPETLQQAWQQYAGKLEEQQKHSAAQAFRSAALFGRSR